MLTRRHFLATSGAIFSGALPSFAQETAPLTEGGTSEIAVAPPAPRPPRSNRAMWDTWDARVTPAGYVPETSNPWGFHPRFLPRVVEANPGLRAGDIHVDAIARYLYFVRADGTAMRYGVAIARGNLYEPGSYRIGAKRKWPTWRPTDAMIKREPQTYKQFENGMDGGPSNPLGARALYLYEGRRDTYLRIHGTPHPRSIGGRASSGCVRMVMAHIIGLYDEVETGSTAHLYDAELA